MNKNQQKALWALGAVALGVWLFSNPKCNRGCKTLAEHLLSHGIDTLLA